MPTPHPLDGAKLKIVRAQEHLKSFNEEAGRYIGTEPYRISTRMNGNNVCVEGVVTTEPPPSLACIIGDFVTNLRASLDYIARELAVKFAPRPLTDREKRNVTFPIISAQPNFAGHQSVAHLTGVCGVPAAAITEIEGVQPYNAGYEPIGTLDHLVRIDKHRMLLLCATFIESVGRVLVYRGDKLLSIGSGMNFATYASPSPIKFDVKVDEKPTVLIALKDFPSPPMLTYVGILENVFKCVANVIPRFETFF